MASWQRRAQRQLQLPALGRLVPEARAAALHIPHVIDGSWKLVGQLDLTK